MNWLRRLVWGPTYSEAGQLIYDLLCTLDPVVKNGICIYYPSKSLLIEVPTVGSVQVGLCPDAAGYHTDNLTPSLTTDDHHRLFWKVEELIKREAARKRQMEQQAAERKVKELLEGGK